MTEHASVRLRRAQSSRGDYVSMARLARALYARGLCSWEVLRECYGVDFPEEFFATSLERLARPPLLATFTSQPWELGQREPASTPGRLMESVEERIFARDTDLVPLMKLNWAGIKVNSTVICYRLTELRTGSTTVFAIKSTAAPHDQIVRCGESLLAVLHAHHTEVLLRMEWTLRQPWNWGFGAESERAADEVRSLLERVEELQRLVA